MAGRAPEPIAIPVWAWKREEIRRILQERDIAGLLRFAQRYGGASQTRLAAATGIAQGRISEILNGRKRVTSFEVVERIADGLGMPDQARMLFGLAPLNLAILTGDSTAATASTAQLSPPSVEEEEKEDRVKRRQFISLAGAGIVATAGSLTGADRIAAALTRYTTSTTAHGPSLTIEALTKAVRSAKIGYQACHYGAVAQQLPTLLDRLAAATATFTGDDLQTAYILQAEAYHVASSVLLKSEERGLAWLAADRSMQAAERSENPTTIGASARIVTHTLMKDRHYGPATELATSMAERIDHDTAEPSPDSLSVYGALLLRGAAAAAKNEDRAQALTLLDEAEEAGRRLGGDHNYQWTAFGPTNVLLHRVTIAVALGDAGSAIDYARQVRLDNIDVTERKATLFIDAARAYAQWNKLDRAYEALMTAERFAPEALRTRPAVHQLITNIHARSTGHLRANMTELAERAGIAA